MNEKEPFLDKNIPLRGDADILIDPVPEIEFERIDDIDQYVQDVIKYAMLLSDTITFIQQGKVNLKIAVSTVSLFVQIVEKLFDFPHSGMLKSKTVKLALNELEKRYSFKTKLASILPLPFYLAPFKKVIVNVVLNVSIEVIVFIYNTLFWKNNKEVV